ncbi:uncharacterized protein L201_007203 [Kwoniella dendrophila CBS 6074]|uniref:GPI mannosyltransferase 2 n=1 Tax=Kwoniella dendrophila CBS 6074 TaxID=1295534 RepID=A0AAX4K4D3_9TREE
MFNTKRTLLTQNDLVTESSASHSTSTRQPSASNTILEEQASQLISYLKSSTFTPYSHDSPTVDLTAHLYALRTLHLKESPRKPSLRSRIIDLQIGKELREKLNDRIEDLLDDGCNVEEEDDEELHEILWRRWLISDDGKSRANAMELMLLSLTYNSEPSPFLSHPTIRYILKSAWSDGVPFFRSGQSEKPRAYRLSRQISKIAIAARLHFLHLISFLVLYGLTLSIALSPRSRISPYESSADGSNLSPKERCWMLWTGADLLHSMQYSTTLTHRIVLLPLHLAFLISFFPSYSAITYNLLLISMPIMTLSLVSPVSPSLTLLVQPLLPLSVLLRRILSRSIKTAGLLMPLVVCLVLLFSWSMNGDVFRGFYRLELQSILITASSAILKSKDDVVNDGVNFRIKSELEEPGTSPFSARLTIFTTLSLLCILSLILTASRIMLSPKDKWDSSDERRWKGAIKEGDSMERSYGLIVGRETRQAFAEAVLKYVWAYNLDDQGNTQPPYSANRIDISNSYGSTDDSQVSEPSYQYEFPIQTISPILPPPFNLIILPLNIVRYTPSAKLSRQIPQATYIISLVLSGALSLPLYLFSTVLDRIYP